MTAHLDSVFCDIVITDRLVDCLLITMRYSGMFHWEGIDLQRRRVRSSELFSVGYDEDKKQLEIELLNGSIYLYNGVARMIFEELMASTAINRYYARYIKSSFPFDKLQ